MDVPGYPYATSTPNCQNCKVDQWRDTFSAKSAIVKISGGIRTWFITHYARSIHFKTWCSEHAYSIRTRNLRAQWSISYKSKREILDILVGFYAATVVPAYYI